MVYTYFVHGPKKFSDICRLEALEIHDIYAGLARMHDVGFIGKG